MYNLDSIDNVFVYIIAAVLPAAVLMFYVYKKDTIEREPWSILWRLILGGCFAAVLAGVLEQFGIGILDSLISPDHPFYTVMLAFLVVAVAEEATKFFFLKRRTWRSPDFNYCFDGIVYSVFVSLGFAGLENIGYVMGYGLSIAPIRALLSIPAHMSFAVYMGYFYGRAKRWQLLGNKGQAMIDQVIGYLLAVFLHGFYDACAMMDNTVATVIFFIFVIVVDISVIYMVKRGSSEDEPL